MDAEVAGRQRLLAGLERSSALVISPLMFPVPLGVAQDSDKQSSSLLFLSLIFARQATTHPCICNSGHTSVFLLVLEGREVLEQLNGMDSC